MQNEASTNNVLVDVPIREVSDRLDDAILWFGKTQNSIDSRVEIVNENHGIRPGDPRLVPSRDFQQCTGSKDDNEVQKFLEFLVAQGHLANFHGSAKYQLTPKGWEQVAKLRRLRPESHSAFVAMWFTPEMDRIFEEAFSPAIIEAGYQPVKIDRKFHNNKIDDEIIAELRRARFVVADFTCEILSEREFCSERNALAVARGGVYFEAGFAKGLGKEVIWTVRKEVLPYVHFDTRQYAHIDWDSPADLRVRLRQRISATIGDGPAYKM